VRRFALDPAQLLGRADGDQTIEPHDPLGDGTVADANRLGARIAQRIVA
jgi:hypothetical protein